MAKKARKKATKKAPARKKAAKKARKKAGRPPWEPKDWERAGKQVRELAGFGVPHKQIGAFLEPPCSFNTLRQHFQDDLDAGKARANLAVAQTLFRKATSSSLSAPSVSAAIFWLKAQAGWKDRSTVEFEDPKGVLRSAFGAAVKDAAAGD